MSPRFESFMVCKLDLYFHDVQLGAATGFFYRFGQSIALVTNWHVLAGADPSDGRLLDRRGFVPNRLVCNINLFDKQVGSVVIKEVEFPLIGEDGQTTWRQSSGQDPAPDIAFILMDDHLPDFEQLGSKIMSLPADIIVIGTDQERAADRAFPQVMDDVFILGYPQGISAQGVLPIWKRGSIATEPLMTALDNAPVMLVDAATRSGMSGAPVLHFGRALTTREGKPVDLGRSDDDLGWLVGVYAGREGVTEVEADMALGRVWHRDLLDQMFFESSPGPYLLNQSGAKC
jgi:Trypsin-like peptidase domain